MTVFITGISAGGTDEIIVNFEITHEADSSRQKLLIPVGVYTELGIGCGECSADTFDIIERESAIYSAYKRGMYILSFGACSQKMLASKLVAKGFEREYATLAANRIAEHGYIDDSAAARREAERCIAKLWGEMRIRAHLLSKGYSRDVIDGAIFELEEEGVDFDENCALLVKRKADKLPKEFSERQKLVASLARYGYSTDQIKKAFSKHSSLKNLLYFD